jgi:hypothetical protein
MLDCSGHTGFLSWLTGQLSVCSNITKDYQIRLNNLTSISTTNIYFKIGQNQGYALIIFVLGDKQNLKEISKISHKRMGVV